MSADGLSDREQGTLRQQVAYYRARAVEYDQWFHRQGRYDRGAELNAIWRREVEEVRAALAARVAGPDILELACGTGLWTEHLARLAERVTAVDAAPEMLELCRRRLAAAGGASVRFLERDLFTWEPGAALYDTIFFGFWLSHVPLERFDAFWRPLAAALKPRGRVFLVDSLYDPTSTARDHRLAGRDAVTVDRRLNDGRQFGIVKLFHDPERLTARLAALGWRADLCSTQHYFLYGSATLIDRP